MIYSSSLNDLTTNIENQSNTKARWEKIDGLFQSQF